MSFGEVADDPPVKEANRVAVSRGVVVVAAGGDTGSPNAIFPADLNDVIAARALAEDWKATLYANTVGSNGIDAPGESVRAVRGNTVFLAAGLQAWSSPLHGGRSTYASV